MTSGSWEQVKSLFGQLRAMPPGRRGLALRDAGLTGTRRADVGDLLACAEEMGSFLERPWMADPAAVADPWRPGDCVSGRYRIVRLIGRGGMGEVYEAEDLELRTRVALKTMRSDVTRDEASLARLRREVELARRIAHPNVCRIFDLGRDERDGHDELYLSMELLAGETLEARITRDGPLREPEATAIAAQLCAGLDAAHDAGVIHRDLKTANVMLVPAAGGVRAVITDFGLACAAHATSATSAWPSSSGDDTASSARATSASGVASGFSAPAVTRAGDLFGTPHYMAPEQVSGGTVDQAADIFALGVVLYRLVSGRYPYDGATAWQVMVRRLTEAPAPLRDGCPDIPARWERAVMPCLARERRQRPGRAGDVIRAIEGRGSDRAGHQRVLVMMTAIAALCVWPDSGAQLLTTTPLPQTKRVAVLPFTLAASERASALAEGISESVSARLADLRQLDPQLSSVPFADLRAAGASTLSDARRLFGVNLAVTGVVRSAGAPSQATLQVSLRLIEASTGRPLRQEEASLGGDASTLARPLLALLDMSPTQAQAAALQQLRVASAGGAVIAPSVYEFYEQGKGYLLRSGEHDVEAAIALFHRAVEAQPTFALAQAALARAYAKRYQRAQDAASADAAQQAAAAALRIDPSLAAAHTARGMVLRQAGRRDEAVQAFEAALRIDGRDAETLSQLASTYEELGDPLRAEATFQRAIRANPGYFGGHSNLGRFYLQHRQFDQARQQFRWATELAPDNPRVQSNLGGLYLMLGAYADARATLRHAYDLQPTAAICSNLGTASLALGDTAHAVNMFEQAVALAPRDHRYRRNLGDAYEVAGRLDDARAAWGKAAEMLEASVAQRSGSGGAVSADQWATAALYRAKLRDTAAATRWLTEAARVLRPDDAGAQLKIAQAQELIGDRSAALETLARAVGAGLAVSEIEQSTELARLRRDPRYASRVAAPAPAAP